MVPIVLGIFAIIAIVALLCMFGLFAFLIARAAKRRSYDPARGQQMQLVAAQIGFTFQPQAELSALPFFSTFELFEGSPLKFENLMNGKIKGRDAWIFDLAYRNVGGRSGGTTTSRQTMVAMMSGDLKLPEFYLRPEGVIEKVLNSISQIDIDFPERPSFSERFLLYGKDVNSIRQIFDPPKLDFFEKNSNLSSFGRGNYLLAYFSRTPAVPSQIPQYLDLMAYLHHLFRS